MEPLSENRSTTGSFILAGWQSDSFVRDNNIYSGKIIVWQQ